jgi:hypothetical protein
LGQTGVIGDSKIKDFKNLQFLPQNDQKNTQAVFGTSEMITCYIYHKKIQKDLRY